MIRNIKTCHNKLWLGWFYGKRLRELNNWSMKGHKIEILKQLYADYMGWGINHKGD